MRVDFTLNIPTIVAMVGMIVTTAVAGVTIYNQLDRRQIATDFAVSAQAQRIDKIEANVDKLKIEATAQNTQLRTEIKSDITEIKGLLNEVIFGRGRTPPSTNNQHLREWSK
jgi:hypothetical protein